MRTFFRHRIWIPVIALFFAIPADHASAHDLGQSYLYLSIDDARISGRLEITFADINTALGLSLPTKENATLESIQPHLETIKAYFEERVSIQAAEGDRPLRFGEHRIGAMGFAHFLHLDFTLDPFSEAPEYLDIRFAVLFDVEPQHQNYVLVEENFKTGTFANEDVFSLAYVGDDIAQRLDLTESSLWLGFFALVKLGIHHIWIGIDHILFLMALLLPAVLYRKEPSEAAWAPAESFRDAFIHVVKIVTIFTLAHSVTLSLAAFGIVELSPRIVESIIAISIAIAALDIIFPVFRGHIWIVVFVFGLFHGFGFASVLGGMGIGSSYLALTLFGFNVGVEIGQVVIIAAVFPVLFVARRLALYRFPVVQAGALALMFVSLYWFTERAFEVDLPLGEIVQVALGLR